MVWLRLFDPTKITKNSGLQTYLIKIINKYVIIL